MMYRTLVLEGGGVLQFAYLGALEVLVEQGHLQGITRFVGSSAGAMIAGLLACGMTIPAMKELYETFTLEILADRTCMAVDLYRVWHNYGLYLGDVLYEWYGKVLKNLTGDADISLGEILQRYQREAVITGTNLTRHKTVFFNAADYPTMPLRYAVRISCSYPFFFQAVRYQGDVWVDGGLLNNFPMDYCRNTPEEASGTLGLKLVDRGECANACGDRPITNLYSYVQHLVNALCNQALLSHVHPDDWKRTVAIHTGSISAMDFAITQEQREWLMEQGRVAVQGFFKDKISI